MAATAMPAMPLAGQAAGGDIEALWKEATSRRLRLSRGRGARRVWELR
jgi:hypothetical protein